MKAWRRKAYDNLIKRLAKEEIKAAPSIKEKVKIWVQRRIFDKKRPYLKRWYSYWVEVLK